MDYPYLVQTARFREAPLADRKGIDQILSFDYMGAAEYEFGALPQSLKRMRESKQIHSFFEYKFKGTKKSVFVLAPISLKDSNEGFEAMADILENLAKNKYRLKCPIRLKDYITPDKSSKWFSDGPDFYWDIENDFMFWKSEKAGMNQQVISLLSLTAPIEYGNPLK